MSQASKQLRYTGNVPEFKFDNQLRLCHVSGFYRGECRQARCARGARGARSPWKNTVLPLVIGRRKRHANTTTRTNTTIMKSSLLAAEPPSPTSPIRGLTLRQQRNMFAGISQAAPSVWLESEDGGGAHSEAEGIVQAGGENMLERGGSATSTMEWRPLSMEQVCCRSLRST